MVCAGGMMTRCGHPSFSAWDDVAGRIEPWLYVLAGVPLVASAHRCFDRLGSRPAINVCRLPVRAARSAQGGLCRVEIRNVVSQGCPIAAWVVGIGHPRTQSGRGKVSRWIGFWVRVFGRRSGTGLRRSMSW